MPCMLISGITTTTVFHSISIGLVQLTVRHHIQVPLRNVEGLNSVQRLGKYCLQVQPTPVVFQLLYTLLPFEGIPSSLNQKQKFF